MNIAGSGSIGKDIDFCGVKQNRMQVNRKALFFNKVNIAGIRSKYVTFGRPILQLVLYIYIFKGRVQFTAGDFN